MSEAERVRGAAGGFTEAPDLLAEPVKVLDGTGTLQASFVPMVRGDRLAGFVQLDPELVHQRTSWFGRAPLSVEGCPPASWWLDPATVLRHAAAQVVPGEVPGDPYLSFDGTPDRSAWAVPIDGPSGRRIIYVAGDAAWSATGAPGRGVGGGS